MIDFAISTKTEAPNEQDRTDSSRAPHARPSKKNGSVLADGDWDGIKPPTKPSVVESSACAQEANRDGLSDPKSTQSQSSYLQDHGGRQNSLTVVPSRPYPCDNCPFVSGTPLHDSLTDERKAEFQHEAVYGWFPCHKTSSTRMALQEQVVCEENGVTAWDMLALKEKIAVVSREQECAGARAHRDALTTIPIIDDTSA